MTWDLAEAKDRLSEVVKLALNEGPRTITSRTEAVIVISAERYAELTSQRPDFKEYLLGCPTFDGLDVSRDRSPMRDVEL